MNLPAPVRTAGKAGKKGDGLSLSGIEDAPRFAEERFPCKTTGRSCRRLRRGLLLLLTTLLLAGCGYRFAGDAESVAPAFRTVFVDIFANRTSEAYAENIFRGAFISRFVQEGRFALAGSRGEADLICRGAVRDLRSAPLAYKPTNLSAEDRLTVTLSLSLEERESGRVIWTENAFVGTGDYPVTTAGATESSRKTALVKLAADTAERVYRLMLSGF